MPFLFDIFFTYISNAKPFPSFPSEDPLFTTPTPAPQPTHSHFPGRGILHYWGLEQ